MAAGVGFPDQKARKARLYHAVPAACIDDSGNEPTKPHFILGGFVAPAASWATLRDEWQAALNEPPQLEYFKMREAARLRGQFDPINGWDEQKRDDRLITLVRIIKRHVGLRIHVAIKHSDIDKYVKSIAVPERRLVSDTPYILLFFQIIVAMIARQDMYGIKEPCDFIFDDQVGFSVDALASWPSIKWSFHKNRPKTFANMLGSSQYSVTKRNFFRYKQLIYTHNKSEISLLRIK